MFGYNEPIYEFVTYSKKHDIIYGDEVNKIIVNTSAEISNETKLGKFINYLKDNIVSDDFTSSINDTINEIKLDSETRGEYMVLEAKIYDTIIMTYVDVIRTITEKEGISIDEVLIKLDIPEEYWNDIKKELLNE